LEILKQHLDRVLKLSDADWNAFRSAFRPTTLLKGTYFAQAGQVEYKIGFMLSGVIRAFYRTPEAIEYNKTFFVEGDFFGAYASIVRGTENRIHIQALTDCDVLEAKYADIVALFENHRAIETFARLTAEQMYIEKENREIELALLQADERYGLFQKQYPGIENLIPQYHVASYLGITPTQLSRIRAKK